MVQIQYFDSVEEIVARYGDSIPSNIICVAGANDSVMLNSGNNNPHQEEEEEQQQIQIFTIKNQDLNVDPTEETLVLTADEGYTGLGTVTISGIQASRLIEAITTNGEYHFSPEEGHYYTGIDIEVDVQPALEDKVVAPSTSQQIIGATEGYYGLNSVTIEAVDATIDPDITAENIRLGVNVLGIEGTCNPNPALVSKTVDPSTSSQTVEAGSNYYGLQTVTVRAVTSAIDSNISADNIKSGVTILGVTGTLTPGITPSGSTTVTSNGVYDVTEYATVEVSVPTESGDVDEIYEALEDINVGEVVIPHSYSYLDGSVDENGLRALGWDDESIAYYRDNVPHYSEQNNKYTVSQANIEMYDTIDLTQPWIYNGEAGRDIEYMPNKLENYSSWFQGFKYLKAIPLFTPPSDWSGQIFKNCENLETIPPLEFGDLTNANGMFQGCKKLRILPYIDFTHTTNMGMTFYECESLENLTSIDCPLNTSLNGTFHGCKKLTSINLNNTGSVTHWGSAFSECENLVDINNFDTSSASNMNAMFYGCKSLKTIPELNMSNVTSAGSMFYNCSSLESVPALDTSRCTDINYLFDNCYSLKDIWGIDFSSVSDDTIGLAWHMGTLDNLRLTGSLNHNFDIANCSSNLGAESIKSVLEACNRTTNTDSKTVTFNTEIIYDSEIADLITSCEAKGWTVSGLNLTA